MKGGRKWTIATFSIAAIAILVSATLGVFPIGRNAAIGVDGSAEREDKDFEHNVAGITMSAAGSESLHRPPHDGISDVNRLVAEFEVTGDLKFLAEAQSLYPGNIDVVILSALNAKSVDDKWIDLLEGLQPNNALPNLIRASFYAEISDTVRFGEEMEIALSKSDFDTHYRQRLARIVDDMLVSGEFPDSVFSDGRLGNLDKAFIERHGNILKMLADNENLFGDAERSAAIGLAWAKKLQTMPGLNLSYLYFGGYLESKILSRYQSEDIYGNEGKTVGDRRNELVALAHSVDEKLTKYKELILANNSIKPSELILRRQFFSRVLADGEMAAVNWLMEQ